MIVQTLVGLVLVFASATLRLFQGRPKGEDEWSAFAVGIVLSFIDGFTVAYLVQFFPVFVGKFLFHLFLYTLLASISIVFYAMYRNITDIRVFAVASTPWFLIIVIIIIARMLGLPGVFIF
jgi:glucan phosphoethanolaminetransferase (alkaline phosphatase superfamily)